MEWTPTKTITRTVVLLMLGVLWLPAVVITVIGLVLLAGDGGSAEIGAGLAIFGGINVVVLPAVLVVFVRARAKQSREQMALYQERIAKR